MAYFGIIHKVLTRLLIIFRLQPTWTRGKKNFDERPHRMLCRYWGLNDAFAAHTAAETPNSFQWSGQPSKLPIFASGSRPNAIIIWLESPTNGVLIGLAVFAQMSPVPKSPMSPISKQSHAFSIMHYHAKLFED